MNNVTRHLNERQTSDSQLLSLELQVTSPWVNSSHNFHDFLELPEHAWEYKSESSTAIEFLSSLFSPSETVDNLTIFFPSTEKRSSWEAAYNEAKRKLAMSTDRHPSPEFLLSLPIRKTRAGLQFTCAAPTIARSQYDQRDVWICNSDGYVGQVCILTLHPTPTVASCNGVCNSRILCITSVPAMLISS